MRIVGRLEEGKAGRSTYVGNAALSSPPDTTFPKPPLACAVSKASALYPLRSADKR
jgi:hypothetical protein